MKPLTFFLLIGSVAVLATEPKSDPFVELLRSCATEQVASCEMLMEYYETITKKVIWADAKTISYRIEEKGYTGGAHDYAKIVTTSIDRVTGKKLKLSDIAPGEQLAELDRRLKEAFVKHKKVKNYAELRKLLQAEPKPTENFYFAKDGLHFVYNEYEIDCYAAGSYDILVPWER